MRRRPVALHQCLLDDDTTCSPALPVLNYWICPASTEASLRAYFRPGQADTHPRSISRRTRPVSAALTL